MSDTNLSPKCARIDIRYLRWITVFYMVLLNPLYLVFSLLSLLTDYPWFFFLVNSINEVVSYENFGYRKYLRDCITPAT
jgi:hypothetical protein